MGPLFDSDFGIGFGCYLFSCCFQGSNKIELPEGQLAVLAELRVKFVFGDGAVCDLIGMVNCQDLLFGHPLKQVAEAQDNDRMADDQHTLMAMAARQGLDDTPQPENNVAPAFTAGRAVIELT